MFQLFYASKVKEFKTYAQARAYAYTIEERWVLADSSGLVMTTSD